MAQSDETDILHQYGEIGAFLRMTARQAQHRVLSGEIPHFKLGRIVCARKSTLLAWMAEQEAKSIRAPVEATTRSATHA